MRFWSKTDRLSSVIFPHELTIRACRRWSWSPYSTQQNPPQVCFTSFITHSRQFHLFLHLKLKICRKSSCKVTEKLLESTQGHKNTTAVSHIQKKQKGTFRKNRISKRTYFLELSPWRPLGSDSTTLSPLHTKAHNTKTLYILLVI